MNTVESLTTAGLISVAMKESVKEYVNIFLKPKLESLHKKLCSEKSFSLTRSKIENYLLASCKNIGYIKSIAFNSSPQELKKFYLPLTLTCKTLTSSKTKPVKEVKIKIDYQQSRLLHKYDHVSIVDAAGMGKTTILKCLFLQAIASSKHIPVFIDAKRLSTADSLIDYVAELLGGGKVAIEREIVTEMADRGDLLILIDGYDEVKTADLDNVVKKINVFVTAFNRNKFVLTSRPESSSLLPPFFTIFNIVPLSEKQAISLIKKYDVNGTYSDLIVDQIKSKKLPQITEFLVNPLLVSLLYVTFCYKKDISYLKKHLYYRNVYDALYESHDYTKDTMVKREKKSGLDTDDFHRVMRCFGFITAKDFQTEYTKDECTKYLAIVKDIVKEITFKDNDLLFDLCANVPLFTRDGNYYRWAHKSLQEYFAAQFICIDMKESQAKYLNYIFDQKAEILKSINILEMCWDIDPKTFKKTILIGVIKDFLKYSDELVNKYVSFDAEIVRRIAGNTYLFDVNSVAYTGADKDISNEVYKSEMNATFMKLINNMTSNNITRVTVSGSPMRFTSFTINNPLMFGIVKMLSEKDKHFFYDKDQKIIAGSDLVIDSIVLSRGSISATNGAELGYIDSILSLNNDEYMQHQKCKALLEILQEEQQHDDYRHFM